MFLRNIIRGNFIITAIRFIFRWIVIFDYWFDRYIIKKFIFKTRYIRTGACQQCGTCCNLIGVCAPQYILGNYFFKKLVTGFYEFIYEFKYSHTLLDEKVILFTCNKFDRNKGKCTNYSQRPAVCRNYPLVRYFEKPVVFDSCGYKPKLR